MFEIAIIGGGASGLAAACALATMCAQGCGSCARESVRIVLIEASDKVGRSILRSGNGRCNFSNLAIDPDCYNDSSFVHDVLRAFEDAASRHSVAPFCEYPNGVIGFLADAGLLWEEVGEGRVYPITNKASSVLDILRALMEKSGIEVLTGVQVSKIVPVQGAQKRFAVHLEDESVLHADALIYAPGGKAAQSIELPLPLAPLRPILASLATTERDVRALDGIRVHARLSVLRDGAVIFADEGEVLFRKYGISGIVTFDASRFASAGDALVLDLFPDRELDDLTAFLIERQRIMDKMRMMPACALDCLSGILLPAFASVMLKRVGIPENARVDESDLRILARQLKHFELTCDGIGDAEHSQVMRGGIHTSVVERTTLEATDIPHLFVCGEALDVDGPCGGFNLHWAFASGLLAGWVLAERLQSESRCSQ